MRARSLPPVLLEFTLSRVCTSTPGPRRQAVFLARHAHAAASLRTHNDMEYEPLSSSIRQGLSVLERKQNSMGVKPRPGLEISERMSELERRVKALGEVATIEESATEMFYSEQDLLAIYEDLLAIQPEEQHGLSSTHASAPTEDEIMHDLQILSAAEERLLSVTKTSSREVTDASELEQDWIHSEDFSATLDINANSPSYRRILRHVMDILNDGALEEQETMVPQELQQTFPVSILQLDEWNALLRISVHSGDGDAAQAALALIKRCGLVVPDEMLDSVLLVYSRVGDVTGFEKTLRRFATESPSEPQRHLHIKTRLKASPIEDIPTSALAVLHNYECQSLPAPMKTYTSVIRHLFSLHSSVARAHAWDLFSHMRYAAHPTPDAHLYALMIRACASPVHTGFRSEPERALDLWQEMQDKGVKPTVGAYNAAILSCARSGEKPYVAEAFRLAKEMLDSYRDARGRQAYTPDRHTFYALLEGAKRIGDLARARWILAELVRMSGEEGAEDLAVDEDVMMHVFHAYASYNPPFTRNLAKVVEQGSTGHPNPDRSSAVGRASPGQEVHAAEPSFRHLAPQSKSEVLGEVDSLLEQIHYESQAPPSPRLKFRNVHATSKLVNAYMSVHYRHDTFEKSRALFWSVYERFGVEHTPRAYLEALNKCAHASKRDRASAYTFAEDILLKWRDIEDSIAGSKLDARVVEKMHLLYIRVLSHHDSARALEHLKAFTARYPPASLRTPLPPKSALRSTRTSLVASRPLVRLSSPIEIPDDSVPPFLTFDDLELLHHKLVEVGDIKGVGYIKFITKAYEWALRVRRDESNKAAPVSSA